MSKKFEVYCIVEIVEISEDVKTVRATAALPESVKVNLTQTPGMVDAWVNDELVISYWYDPEESESEE